jgi:hypothetical protein
MKTLKLLFVCFLVLSFAAALSVPAMGYDIPEIPNDIAINRANPNAAPMGKFGKAVSEVNLKGAPNPGPKHIKVEEEGYLITVRPLPKPSVSASNAEAKFVQWAVDNVKTGGIVRLEMTDINEAYRVFDFGGHTVTALNNVIIEGVKESSVLANEWEESLATNQPFEIIEQGTPRTILSDRAVIYNGQIVAGKSDIVIDENCELVSMTFSPPKDATIRSLRLEKSPLAAIVSESADEYVVYDNVVTNVVPGVNPSHACEFEYLEAYGIVAIGKYSNLRSATIEHNLVDLFGDNPANDPSYPDIPWATDSRADGIFIGGFNSEPGIEKSASIKNNAVKNCPLAAIYIVYPYGAYTIVEGNDIEQREFLNMIAHDVTLPDGSVVEDYLLSYSVGIDVLNFLDDAEYPARADIINNTMINVRTKGITLFGVADSYITGNTIQQSLLDGKTYKDTVWGLDVMGGITVLVSFGNEFDDNTIYGTGAYAYFLKEWAFFNTIIIDDGDLDGYIPATSGMPDPGDWPNSSNKVFLGETTFGNTIDALSLDCDEITNLGPAGPDVPPIPNAVICTP